MNYSGKQVEQALSRETQKQLTKQKILETADQLFKQHGFANVSTRLIAKESNVGVGTVFSHFQDKQALSKALFHEKIDEKLAEHLKKAQSKTTGLEFFLSFAEFFYDFYDQDRAFSQELLQNALFDVSFFGDQMLTFISQIAEKLSTDLPEKNDYQRFVLAKAWFGFYMFQLFSGLSQEKSTPKDWLDGLKADCEGLLV